MCVQVYMYGEARQQLGCCSSGAVHIQIKPSVTCLFVYHCVSGNVCKTRMCKTRVCKDARESEDNSVHSVLFSWYPGSGAKLRLSG